MILYTDGLIERRLSTIDDDIARLCEIAATLDYRQDLEDYADAIIGLIGLIGHDTRRSDDAALMIVRRTAIEPAGECDKVGVCTIV